MKIKELHLKDVSVIREAKFEDLSNFVVIAGPNGVGKTKVKDAIVHVFRSGGNPPASSSITLEATNQEELKTWGSNEVSLPQGFWASFFNTQQKKLKTKSRIIQIDANRSIDTVSFQQLTFSQIGDPEQESVGFDYGVNNIKDRFQDICRTLHRLKSKEVTAIYQEYTQNITEGKNEKQVTLNLLPDSTAQYIKLFNNLLYPKSMMPIDITSSTIQFKDEDGAIRPFSELSSGEREVVILTFDILAQNPSDCLILIDEPEVHLHPELTFRLIKSLKGIGERNQIFLFTHSPDIIGSSFDFGVYFIRPKSRVKVGNQVVKITEENIEELNSIPNIRETIGMVSVGKKILFVEGTNTSIDRNVFATIAKDKKINLAIVPSNSCTTVAGLSQVCNTLSKGIFGVEFNMIRDRDSLNETQIDEFSKKSNGKLLFLPFYHIENAFLLPEAISEIANKILLSKAPSKEQIEERLVDFAKKQISYAAAFYVKNEIYFQASAFDVSPAIDFNQSVTNNQVVEAIKHKRDTLIRNYGSQFSNEYISSRLSYWTKTLTDSLQNGWSPEARKYFLGKQLLRQLQANLFGGKTIQLWEHILEGDGLGCKKARQEIEAILDQI